MQQRPPEAASLPGLLPELLLMIIWELKVEDPLYFVQLMRVCRQLSTTLRGESFKVYWQHRLHHDFPIYQGIEVVNFKDTYKEAWLNRRRQATQLTSRRFELFKKVRRGDLEGVKKGHSFNSILGNGFDPYSIQEFMDVFDRDKKNALKVAQELDRKEIIEHFHQTCVSAKDDNKKRSPFYWAIIFGDLAEVNKLKEETDLGKPFSDGLLPLFLACIYGDPEIVAALTGEDVRQNSQALFYSAENGHLSAVRYLIKKGAVVNAMLEAFETPIFLAALNAHDKVVAELIKAEANVDHVNTSGLTAIFAPAKFGYLKVVSTLIAAQANVNHTTPEKFTPILLAASGGHLLVVRALITAGASVDVATVDGRTPLLVAVQNRHQMVASELIAAGANVNAAMPDGITPLDLAIRNCDENLTVILMAAGANANAKRSDNLSPMIIAIQRDWKKLVSIMLHAGASLNDNDLKNISLSDSMSNLLDLWRSKIAVKPCTPYHQVIAVLNTNFGWKAKAWSYLFETEQAGVIQRLRDRPDCKQDLRALNKFLNENHHWIGQERYVFIMCYVFPKDWNEKKSSATLSPP